MKFNDLRSFIIPEDFDNYYEKLISDDQVLREVCKYGFDQSIKYTLKKEFYDLYYILNHYQLILPTIFNVKLRYNDITTIAVTLYSLYEYKNFIELKSLLEDKFKTNFKNIDEDEDVYKKIFKPGSTFHYFTYNEIIISYTHLPPKNVFKYIITFTRSH